MIEKITGVNPIGNYYQNSIGRVNPFSEIRIKGNIHGLQFKAAVTNDCFYFQKLLELQNWVRSNERQELFEKYPYDGHSSFKELLINEIKKQG